jgi:hypothetical protein
MPFEQFRVLNELLYKFNSEITEAAAKGANNSLNGHTKDHTTFRITNEG